MKILGFLLKKTEKQDLPKRVDIEREANRAFEQYKKTYKDLARYDRGEKVFTK